MPDSPDSAPGQRDVVVVRAGPPRARGLVIDAVVGILGVALLVMAAVLGTTLPEEETPPRQFKVDYPQDGVEALLCCVGGGDPGLSAREADPVPEGTVTDYEVFVDRDNAFQFQVTFSVSDGDNIPSSEPDRFAVQLIDPDGIVRGNLSLDTAKPVRNPDQNQTNLFISEGVTSGPVSMRFAAKPGTEFVAVNDTSVTKGEVLSQISAEKTLATKGTWTLRVDFVEAGDCPPPAEPPNVDPTRTQRASVCQQETGGSGEDTDNTYTVNKVRYDFYTIEVLSPEEQEDAPS